MAKSTTIQVVKKITNKGGNRAVVGSAGPKGHAFSNKRS